MLEVGETRGVRLGDGVAMTFCWIPPGRFRMGSREGDPWEQPVQEVEIPQGFWLGQTPVTQRQYAAFEAEHENRSTGHPEHPAERIDWNRAVAFCKWLTERLDANEWHGGSAGLPSEAQWEYACRAGTQTDYHTGDGAAALHRAGWFNDNAKGATQPVAQREANGFGLYDMHGNVVEWCRDAWDEHAYRRRAERAAEAGSTEGEDSDPARVVRGGAWGFTAGFCRAACRDRFPPRLLVPRPGLSRGCVPRSLVPGQVRGERGQRARGGTPRGERPSAGRSGHCDGRRQRRHHERDCAVLAGWPAMARCRGQARRTGHRDPGGDRHTRCQSAHRDH